jgi:hypothetical protein
MKWKAVLQSTVVGLAIALAYLAWVGISRRNANREVVREMQEREAAKYKQIVPAGTALKITQFYASQKEVARGESIQICYGVENARSVRMEPPIEEQLPPLPAKCVSFAPKRSTTLTLVAEGDKGGEATASITIKVK